MTKLKGQNAIITGGGRGLGKAMAIAFAKQGINVAITGRNIQALEETVKELQSYGVTAIYASFDVKDQKAVNSNIEQIITTLQGVDILVNNAGIAEFGTFIDMPADKWENILLTNVMGVYNVTKAVLPHLIKKNQGDIFNVASTAGLNGNATTSAYSASKFALIGLSESLMKEVRKNNIRVCTLTPSTIASDMSIELGLTDGNPDHIVQPEDFADLVVATLQLPRRAMLKTASLWTTNPQ